MEAILWSWAVSAVVLVGLTAWLGYAVVPGRHWLGVLVDSRGRFSLTHFQLVIWTILILSLVSGVFWGRLIDDVSNPLSLSIPSEVLGLIGIASGSGVAAGVVKSSKDTMAPERIAASSHSDPPRLSQIFLMEEGAYADKVIDITKFQGFVITLILLVAYAALAVQTVHDAGSAKDLAAWPGFSGTFLTLLGISQGTYIAGKTPSQPGAPPGLTVKNRPTGHKHTMPKGFQPRNAT